MSGLYNSYLSSRSLRRFKVVKPRPIIPKRGKNSSNGILTKFEKDIMTLEEHKNFFSKKNFDLVAKNVSLL